MKNKLKYLAAPYAVWAAGFIIIPMFMILYYAFTAQEGGGFTFANFGEVFSASTMKALLLALLLSLVSTVICLLLAYPLALILARSNTSSSSPTAKVGIPIRLIAFPNDLLIRTTSCIH